MRSLSIIVWVLFAMIMHASCQTPQTVNTPSGPIKGVVVPTLGTDIVQFRNIPYAQPPIGNLRFEKPLPVEPWTETLDGTVFGPSCIQDTKVFEKLWEKTGKHELSEDCLQLNVYVPRAVSTEAKKPEECWSTDGKMRSHYLLHVSLQAIIIAFTSCQSFPVVNTPSGSIKGVVVPYSLEWISYSSGIFHTRKPPVGNLRFEKPLPVEPWTETLDGTVFGPSCMQDKNVFAEFWKKADNSEITEDCLQLNVYVPGAVSTEVKKPVMFWIHGGGFTMGYSWLYDASYLARKDVIVVTINYRLGVFGFLSTEDAELPSNFGLWDMIEALKWVNKNIASFGGDPESVTIFGESAGGFAVSHLALIPSTAGLFKRVIPQSGSAVGFTGVVSNPARVAKAMGKLVGCISEEDEEIANKILIDCLKTKSSEELFKAQQNPGVLYLETTTFLPEIWPAIDGELIRRSPLDSLNDPNSEESVYFRSLDMMAGTTDNEGSLFIFLVFGLQESMKFNITDGIPTSVLCDVVAPTLAKELFNDDTIVSDLLCKEYATDDLAQQARNIANLCEDAWFVGPTVQLCDFHSKDKPSANTYHYLYTKPANMSMFLPEFSWMEGAGHGAEILYMFGPRIFSELDETLSSDEGRTFTDMLVTYWTNFAKTGNPNGDGLVQWEAFTSNGRDYLELNDKAVPGQNLYEKRMKFLLQDVPNKLNDRVKTEL
ncbi:carboxylesterase 1D-like [Pecten maximus]|uniref:carboxylesterase 1D-like n=1 Tax=Pecten maximus TaxID=6579 RepID=UPI0014581355|nr:carboxylesterase 1D-like [Pecten maximus]